MCSANVRFPDARPTMSLTDLLQTRLGNPSTSSEFDFHGTVEWQVFEEAMKRVFPDRPIVDIPDNDPIFHTVYDLDDRYQLVGREHLPEGHKFDGFVARWRGIYDDKGRVMVAISFNSDVGDSWEWADSPEYPERYSALGVRLGVNYIVYAMTH